MTNKEKAKQEKIAEIILSPFKSFFPYKDLVWSLKGKKHVQAAIQCSCMLGLDFNIFLGQWNYVIFPRTFDFSNLEKIKAKRFFIEYLLKRKFLIELYRDEILQNKEIYLAKLKRELNE